MTLDYLRAFMLDACLLAPDKLLVVGVSGGWDSMCLAHVLAKSEYPLLLAHLDHALRPDSAEDVGRVQALAGQLGASFVQERVDVERHAKDHHLSIEEAAREVRYNFLFHVAQKNHAQAVVVGHTADDQVETILMHFLRGAGSSGLMGMPVRSVPNSWSSTIPLVRPLLNTQRKEVEQYVSAVGLSPGLDVSNLDTHFYRNRIRHELIPYLESYNPRIRQLTRKMADILSEEDALLAAQVEAAWRMCLVRIEDDHQVFDLQALHAQPLAVQRRIFRKAIRALRPNLRDLDFAAIEHAVAFIRHPARSRECDLVGGLRLMIEGSFVWLSGWNNDLPVDTWHGKPWPQISENTPIQMTVPGRWELPGGWVLIATQMAGDPALIHSAQLNRDPFQAWLDLAAQKETQFILRTRRPGDRFQPLGLSGQTIKLSDYFINNKLPRRARAGWPLLFSDNRLAWIPGLQLAHPYRVTEFSENLVCWQLDHK